RAAPRGDTGRGLRCGRLRVPPWRELHGRRRSGAVSGSAALRSAGDEAVSGSAGDERGGVNRRPVRLFRHPPSLPAPSVASSTPSSLPVRRTLLAPSSLPAPPALLDRRL